MSIFVTKPKLEESEKMIPVEYGTFAFHNQAEVDFVKKLRTVLAESTTIANALYLTRKVKAYGSTGTFDIGGRYYRNGKCEICVNMAKCSPNEETIQEVLAYAEGRGNEYFAKKTGRTLEKLVKEEGRRIEEKAW